MNNPKFHPYTPPNAPHTPLARKDYPRASRTSPSLRHGWQTAPFIIARRTEARGEGADYQGGWKLSGHLHCRRASSLCKLVLTNFSGPNRIYLGLRDRAMRLMGAATAFRGDSARILLWSDLFKTSIPLGDDLDAPVLGALADNATHNQTGRIDEHGVLRHKHVDLCGVGAVAMMMFGYFHIAAYPVPDFSPDFSDSGYGGVWSA
ncbi:hypothetical protein B0H14DRAFT_3447941 [Mycena olivaceomarginata]|nr:hypothetical protein B0H14DRAFT_3447941 [Mycena olivaceomarginata]